ncbi:OsmC family protein [Streptomyces sp. NPDC005799]|uniref:OsmC family protein n=1 Tax=Streptomyces sp. NPDC005799 TaxID=3154678 RepID=UPI0033F73B35
MTRTAPDTGIARDEPDAEAPVLVVTHVHDDAYGVDVRGHRLLVDQPMEADGTDVAATPAELFTASLATCVAFHSGRYVLRHGLPRAGLRVRAEFTMAADPPARVEALRVVITSPPALSTRHPAALLEIASGDSGRTVPSYDPVRPLSRRGRRHNLKAACGASEGVRPQRSFNRGVTALVRRRR